MVGMMLLHISSKESLIKESVCQKLCQGHKVRVRALGQFECHQRNSQWDGCWPNRHKMFTVSVQNNHRRRRWERQKEVNYLYHMDWIKPKVRNAEVLFWYMQKFLWRSTALEQGKLLKEHFPFFWNTRKQEQTFLHQKEILQLYSIPNVLIKKRRISLR